MFHQVPENRVFLVGWHGEYIAKATTAVYKAAAVVSSCLAGALGFIHRRVCVHLRCSNGSNIRTCYRETRVEFDHLLT